MSSHAVLGLDIASVTGHAYGLLGCKPQAGSVTFGEPGSLFQYRGAALVRWLNSFLRDHPVDMAVIESPLDVAVLARIGATFATTMNQYGLAGIAATVLNMRGVMRIMFADVQDVRAHFVGQRTFRAGYDPIKKRPIESGDMAKQAVWNMARMRGWKADNFDEADALAAWSYGCAKLDPRTAAFSTPLFARAAR